MTAEKLSMYPSGFKAGKLHSQIPISGVGDFDVFRPSVATRINKLGLIETMLANVPLIDYTNGVCPVLLVQPQSTNLIERSETFSHAYWTKSGASVTSGFSAPDGSTNAFKLVASANNGFIQLSSAETISNATSYTNSIFIKRAVGTGNILIKDINNAETNVSTLIGVELADSWIRYDITDTSSSTSGQIGVKLATSGDEVYIFGAQLEEGTGSSYIKSDSGSSTTRLADVITGAGDVNTFSSVNESGVFYVEMARHTDATITNDYNPIGLVNGTDFVFMRYNPNGVLSCFIYVNNVEKLAFLTSIASTDFNKIAIRWSSTDATVYINGVQRTTVSIDASFPASTFDDLSFYQGGDNFYGKVKQLQVLPYLTDDQMITLTTQ